MQPLQIFIGPTIRIGQESWGLPYAGFFLGVLSNKMFFFVLKDSHCVCDIACIP